MMLPDVDWLLDCEPREVQLEALRRSFYGYKLRDATNSEPVPRLIRGNCTPANGWGHLMEMRLGKTPTILNEFRLFQHYHDFNRLVVFSPNQYKRDWALEAEKYGLGIPLIPYEQSRLPHMIAEFNKAKGRIAFAVNYEALQYDETRAFLSDIIDRRTMLAADESIKIKNHASLFTQGAMLARKEAGVTRIATGLPMTQGPTDFYSQGRFIGMYDGLNFFAYRARYCVMGGFKNKQIRAIKNADRLEEEINANNFVAKRKDWGRLSAAEFYEMRLDASPEQQRHYREMEQDFITMVENAKGDEETVSADQIVGKLMKMQQISSGFVYTEDGNAVEIMDPAKTPKVKALIELIENEVKGKIVVPFHYMKSGSMLLEVLAKYNPAVIFNESWMTKHGRDYVSEKARFNNDPNCRVMIGQLTTMKYGHDLTGNPNERCATMFFFENTYSLDDRTQVEARITTAFQDWSNVYLDPYCTPVERKAIKALAKKESVVESVLGAYRDDKVRQEW
jgi:hypothetical protein